VRDVGGWNASRAQCGIFAPSGEGRKIATSAGGWDSRLSVLRLSVFVLRFSDMFISASRTRPKTQNRIGVEVSPFSAHELLSDVGRVLCRAPGYKPDDFWRPAQAHGE
jgi:hypothetical protein